MNEAQLWTAAAGLCTGMTLSAASTAVLWRIAVRRRFVDTPGGHKAHRAPIALGGGIAITHSLLLPIVVCCLVVGHLGDADATQLPDWLAEHLPGMIERSSAALAIAAGALVLHTVGFVDDRQHLGPWIKLAVQVAVAAGLAIGFEIRILTIAGPALSVAATIGWIVLITNAFNLLDNMDGLSAGVAAIAAAILAGSAMVVGQIFVPALALLVVGVMLGYLCYNFPPATIFMGDAGSLVIGYFLAILTILTTYVDTGLQRAPYGLLMPLVILAVPLYDTTSVVVLRLRRGLSPFRADRRHFSHRLVQRGLSPRQAVLIIYAATAATGMLAFLLPGASWPRAGAVLAACGGIVGVIAVLEQVKAHDPH